MREKGRGSALGLLGALFFAISPFAVYAAINTQLPEPSPDWPSPVAVAASFDGALHDFGLADPEAPPTVVLFPIETLLPVPGVGEVRAVTAFRIGGAEALSKGLAALLDVDVPYHVEGAAASIFEVPSGDPVGNLQGRSDQVEAILEGALEGRITVINAPGTYSGVQQDLVRAFHLDLEGLRAELLGAPPPVTVTPEPSPQPSPTASPEPTPALSPQEVSVEVLNAGAPAGSAGRMGTQLEEDGFQIARVADHTGPEPPEGVTVYWRSSEAAGLVVAEAIEGEVSLEQIPEGFSTEADVLVLIRQSA